MNKSIFKTYLIYFIVLVVFVLVRIASSLGAFSSLQDAMLRSNVATIIIQILIMFILPFLLTMWFFKSKPKQVFEKTHFKKISFKAVLICIAIGILMFILNVAVSTMFNTILQLFGYSSGGGSGGVTYDSIGNFVLGVIFVAVLPAFCEEFLHRGIVMRNVGKETNYKIAIIVSSVLFGLMHLNIEQVFYATVLGLIIGFVGAATDSIFPCMILHFVNNFISVYLSFAQNMNLPFGDFYTRIGNLFANNSPIFSLLFTFFVLVVVVIGMIYLIFLLFKETRLKTMANSIYNVQEEISGEISNQPIKKIQDDFKSYILPHLQKNDEDIIEVFMPPEVKKYKYDLSSNMFLVATLVLGVLITLSTLIWGIF